MILTLSTLLVLAQSCAPQVSPTTLLSVATAESGRDPLVIGINTRPRRSLHPANAREAMRAAGALAARNVNFDVGLTQINARNLPRLGLSLADAFDPCRNLAGGALILTRDYRSARGGASGDQAALRAALSRYNTGDSLRGVRNGYVAKVYLAAAQVVPALALGGPSAAAPDRPAPAQVQAAPVEAPPDPTPPVPIDVFARPAVSLVWAPAPGPSGRPKAASPFPQPSGASS